MFITVFLKSLNTFPEPVAQFHTALNIWSWSKTILQNKMQQFSPTARMYNEKHYIENQRTDTKSSQQYLEMVLYLSKCSPEFFFF